MAYLFQSFYQLTQRQTDRDCFEKKIAAETDNIIAEIDQELFETPTQQQAEFYIQKVELAIANHETELQQYLKGNDSIVRAKNLQYCLTSLDTIRHQSLFDRERATFS